MWGGCYPDGVGGGDCQEAFDVGLAGVGGGGGVGVGGLPGWCPCVGRRAGGGYDGCGEGGGVEREACCRVDCVSDAAIGQGVVVVAVVAGGGYSAVVQRYYAKCVVGGRG